MTSLAMRHADVWVSTLARAVHRVVVMGSNEQMARPNTGRVVALVAHHETVGNVPVRHLPRQPMRANYPPVSAAVDTTVAVSKLASNPVPARIGLLNTVPKTNARRSPLFCARVARCIRGGHHAIPFSLMSWRQAVIREANFGTVLVPCFANSSDMPNHTIAASRICWSVNVSTMRLVAW
jgi:hypothetical protein